MGNLGELIYKKEFNVHVHHSNDDLGHLNNSLYPAYSEKVRLDFLSFFGWKDNYFGEGKNLSWVTRSREMEYKRPCKLGESLLINLDVHLGKKPFIHLIYTFRKNPEVHLENPNSVIYKDKTDLVFVDSNSGKIVPVPEFFIDRVRNIKNEQS